MNGFLVLRRLPSCKKTTWRTFHYKLYCCHRRQL